MRFMIIRKADSNTEAYQMPSEQLLAEMGAYHEELAKAGILLACDGLHPSSKGAKVKFTGGQPTVTDGPFAEAKEVIAGYTMIQVRSRAEALEWAKRWPASDGDGHAELELRQVFEVADFGPEFTPELRARADHMRAALVQK